MLRRLIVISIVFQIAHPIFLAPINPVNLPMRAVKVITIAYSVVVILLLAVIVDSSTRRNAARSGR